MHSCVTQLSPECDETVTDIHCDAVAPPQRKGRSMSSIRVSDLNKTYRQRRALRSLSLEVGKGEMVALIGASGSGKSTLLRHIAGLTRADDQGAGAVHIDGKVMQQGGRLASDAQELRREVGVIFQQFNLVDRLSVMTNVLIGLLGRLPAWRGTLGAFTRDEKLSAMMALARVGIEDRATQRASTLSGGQQQRAAIARALVQQARVLLADEPIASLDPVSAKRVMSTLADINREDGVTVVVTLHQVAYARAFCPRAVALREGEIVYDGACAMLTDETLRDIYGEASEELLLPEAPSPAAAPRHQPAITAAFEPATA